MKQFREIYSEYIKPVQLQIGLFVGAIALTGTAFGAVHEFNEAVNSYHVLQTNESGKQGEHYSGEVTPHRAAEARISNLRQETAVEALEAAGYTILAGSAFGAELEMGEAQLLRVLRKHFFAAHTQPRPIPPISELTYMSGEPLDYRDNAIIVFGNEKRAQGIDPARLSRFQ